jgi:uncharacterized protein YecE (DUF72 family)
MGDNGIFIGTSGWTYDDWDGRFYPRDVKGPDRLGYYASKFDTVEVNASFYRVPTQPMIDAWNSRLGPDYHFVLKGPRTVTHLKKLKDCGEPLKFFLDRAMSIKALKVILWQLPPSMHKDTERLGSFLSALPAGIRHAVEFRHESWWDEEVAEVLASHSASFVAVSHPKLPDTLFTTTGFLYVRFHGLGNLLYSYLYSDRELGEWADRLEEQMKGRTLYAFFNNDYHANAVKNALTLRDIMGKAGLRKAG